MLEFTPLSLQLWTTRRKSLGEEPECAPQPKRRMSDSLLVTGYSFTKLKAADRRRAGLVADEW